MQAPGADASPRPSLCLLGWRPVSVGVDSPWGQPGPACPLHRRYHQHPPTAAADNITHATSTINLPPLRLCVYCIRCSETNPCSLWGNFCLFGYFFTSVCFPGWVGICRLVILAEVDWSGYTCPPHQLSSSSATFVMSEGGLLTEGFKFMPSNMGNSNCGAQICILLTDASLAS